MKDDTRTFSSKANVIAIGHCSIAFVILLFIVVAGSMTKNEMGFRVNHTTHSCTYEATKPLIIGIQGEHRWIYPINGDSEKIEYSDSNLKEAIQRSQIKDQEVRAAYIQVSYSSKAGKVVQTIDDLRTLGIRQVRLSNF